MITNAGEELENDINELVDNIERKKEAKEVHESMSRLAVLLKKQVPLKPGKCYDLNWASFWTCLIEALTFSIILLQFKLSN